MTPAIRYGLLGGVVVIFYFALLYVAMQNLFLSPLLQWGSMAAYLFFMWKATQEDVRLYGKSRDFREIVRTPFVTFLLINLCYWLFYYGLHLFDPGLLLAEMSLELDMLKEQLAEGLGDPQQSMQFRERIIALEKAIQHPQQQPLGPVVMRMCVGAVGGFGLAAGVTALVKNQKSVA
jgi:hypothetical protein